MGATGDRERSDILRGSMSSALTRTADAAVAEELPEMASTPEIRSAQPRGIQPRPVQPLPAAPGERAGGKVLRGEMKVLSRTLKLITDSPVELHNISDRVREQVQHSGIRAGFLILSTLHTTTALFLNEFQAALMADLTEFLERFVDREGGFLHNCEDCSDCERKNADAHLRAAVLGHNVTVPIHEGEISLGQWQSILFAELDGPRERTVTAHLIGV